jgi:hypothetical protein
MTLGGRRGLSRLEAVGTIRKERACNRGVASGDHRKDEQLVPEDMAEIAFPVKAPRPDPDVAIDDVG